jgi:hypothetical protein
MALSGSAVAAQEVGIVDPLLDHLVGEWVLEGTIAGEQVTHDIEARWVLGHHYLQIHDVARERDAAGASAYEAIVLIGWDSASQRYACLWLDSTGGDGLKGEAIGYGERRGDSIPFGFAMPDGGTWQTTFAYDRAADTWAWSMDVLQDGAQQPFARVTLQRK